MLTASVILFLYVALGGLVMAVRIFQGAKPSVPLALGHGALAATALVLVLLAAVPAGAAPLLKYAAAALVLATLSGFFLLSFHVRGKPHPKGIVVVHALVAVAGVACLALYWL